MHFLLGGAALFGLYGWVDEGSETETERITVSEEQIAMLATTFERTWQRPPTGDEFAGLIDDYVTEEVLYREALKLGLDENDLVVRRRMRQKMEFLREDLREAPEPTDTQLTAFIDAHRSEFFEPERLSIRQLFVNRERAGAEGRERALRLLSRVRSEPDRTDGLGDPTLLPRTLEAVTPKEIDQRFGEGFARAVSGLPDGTWAGPVESEFGFHVVFVDERRPSRLPELAEIRSHVTREWEAEGRRQAVARFHRLLRERYEIEIRLPSGTVAPSLASRAP